NGYRRIKVRPPDAAAVLDEDRGHERNIGGNYTQRADAVNLGAPLCGCAGCPWSLEPGCFLGVWLPDCMPPRVFLRVSHDRSTVLDRARSDGDCRGTISRAAVVPRPS